MQWLSAAAARQAAREGNREIRISKKEALAKRLVDKGLKGDTAAIRIVIANDVEPSQELEAQGIVKAELQPLDPEDEEILQHFADLAREGAWTPESDGDES